MSTEILVNDFADRMLSAFDYLIFKIKYGHIIWIPKYDSVLIGYRNKIYKMDCNSDELNLGLTLFYGNETTRTMIDEMVSPYKRKKRLKKYFNST